MHDVGSCAAPPVRLPIGQEDGAASGGAGHDAGRSERRPDGNAGGGAGYVQAARVPEAGRVDEDSECAAGAARGRAARAGLLEVLLPRVWGEGGSVAAGRRRDGGDGERRRGERREGQGGQLDVEGRKAGERMPEREGDARVEDSRGRGEARAVRGTAGLPSDVTFGRAVAGNELFFTSQAESHDALS